MGSGVLDLVGKNTRGMFGVGSGESVTEAGHQGDGGRALKAKDMGAS